MSELIGREQSYPHLSPRLTGQLNRDIIKATDKAYIGARLERIEYLEDGASLLSFTGDLKWNSRCGRSTLGSPSSPSTPQSRRSLGRSRSRRCTSKAGFTTWERFHTSRTSFATAYRGTNLPTGWTPWSGP